MVDDRRQIVEAVVGGRHRPLPVRPLGQLAVAEQREHPGAGGVSLCRDRHPDADRQAMPEAAGIHLDPGYLSGGMTDEGRLVVAECVDRLSRKESLVGEHHIQGLD